MAHRVVIGFPGPKSIADTNNLEYSLRDRLVLKYDWAKLIPYLQTRARNRKVKRASDGRRRHRG